MSSNRQSRVSLVILAALLAISLPGASQQKAASDSSSDKPPIFSSRVKVVNVLTTVRDKKGQIIRDMTKEDFTLEEDGRPQTIKYFSRETDLPLTLGLLVDTSLSQLRVLDQERSASYTFLDTIMRPQQDNAFVIHFDSEVELLQDVTSSRQKLQRSLDEVQARSVIGPAIHRMEAKVAPGAASASVAPSYMTESISRRTRSPASSRAARR